MPRQRVVRSTYRRRPRAPALSARPSAPRFFRGLLPLTLSPLRASSLLYLTLLHSHARTLSSADSATAPASLAAQFRNLGLGQRFSFYFSLKKRRKCGIPPPFLLGGSPFCENVLFSLLCRRLGTVRLCFLCVAFVLFVLLAVTTVCSGAARFVLHFVCVCVCSFFWAVRLGRVSARRVRSSSVLEIG